MMSISKTFVIAASLLLGSAPAWAAPQIIAHRGGTGDAPENTLPAIGLALKNGADAVWVTVQLSKDGMPVLYRPSDLSALTPRKGPVSAYTAAELVNTDAGWAFGSGDQHPWRGKQVAIPTLAGVLTRFPDVTFYLDIKSPDAAPEVMAAALAKVLRDTHSLARIRVYSTDSRYLAALPPEVPRFESRDLTRTVLANITMAHQCTLEASAADRWYGLELQRKVEVVEKYTLGEARSAATLVWDKEAVDCFRSRGKAHIVLFGVNSPQALQQAIELGADGVLVDAPSQFAAAAH
ncbi:glycerophosphodiester phosphodiesterase [Chimaeribacter arupi]|nr:glycerophosphodiester phosphodiesterase [Chimaeribacter arupi]